jgi:hypothetical protein
MSSPVRVLEHDAVAHAFRAAGAVSPADARSLDSLPGIDPHAVLALATRGVIREASPGRYYLYTGTEHERRQRLITAVLIGTCSVGVTVGLPLLLWWLKR